MKRGSALLSLVVGMLIASTVFIVLINSLNQFIKVDSLLNNNIDQTKRFIIACTQLEKDITGTSVIHQATRNKRKKSNEKEKNPPEKNSAKNEKKPLKECFLLKGNPTEQILLSFITSNSKDEYWPKQTATNSSFLKRITYNIERDPNNKQSFRLMRHESSDLTFIKPQKSIILLDHIASMSISVSYRVYVQEKKSPQQPNQKSEKKQPEKQKKVEMAFKTTHHWNDSLIYEEKEELFSRIPDTLIITYELFDNQFKNKSHHAQTISLLSEGFYGPTKTTKTIEQVPVPPADKKEERAPFPTPPGTKGTREIAANNKKESKKPKIVADYSLPSFLNQGGLLDHRSN